MPSQAPNSITDPLGIQVPGPDSGTRHPTGFPTPTTDPDQSGFPDAGEGFPAPVTDPVAPAARSDAPAPAAFPELPETSGLPDLPPAPSSQSLHRIHEAKTAVYSVPATIRGAAGQSRAFGAGSSSGDAGAIDLDDEGYRRTTGNGAPPAIDLPSPEPDFIDSSEVMLVSADPAPSSEGDLSADPFAADAGNALGLQGDAIQGGSPTDSVEHALGRIRPSVVGGVVGDAVGEAAGVHNGFGAGPAVAETAGPETAGPETAGPETAATAMAMDTPARVTRPPREELEPQPALPRGGGMSLGVKLITTVAGLGVLAVGVLLWMGGGRLDLSVLGLGGKDHTHGSPAFRDVHPVAMRSVLYPTRNGKQVLVFVGRAENRAAESREQIAALAELHNRKGNLVASARAPVGLALDPGSVADLTDAASLAAAYRELAVEQGQPTLASRAVVPFTVVLLEPPERLAELRHTVRLVEGEPVVVPEPEVTEPEVTEPAVVEEEEPWERKSKRRRKGKRRRAKRKGFQKTE
jgi:hypothetical protein